jgi:hypothetical protein
MSRKKSQESNRNPSDIVVNSGRKGVRGNPGFSFFGISCDGIDSDLIKRHIFYLALLSVLTKVIIFFTTTFIFHSFIDYFDFQYYLQSASNIAQGQIPYVSFGFDYPPLAFIPIILAFIPAVLLNNTGIFVLLFQVQMVICDIVIVICVYLIGLKLYTEKTAFTGALLYATAFSAAYFVLTKYDAFPTSILMLAVLFSVYSKKVQGYLALVIGFFVKIFPVIALPFIVLYNAKSTSLKQEIVSILKIGIPVLVILLLPFLLLKPEILLSYFSGSLVRNDVYVNTATNTLYAYLHDVVNLGIPATAVSNVMYLIMGLMLLLLAVAAWVDPKKEPRHLIKFLLVAVFTVVFCLKYHSPQYIIWFTPFVCLLVADSLTGVILFYGTQVLTYLEFPLLFGTLYVNGEYLSPAGSYGWYLALFFFTLVYAAYLALVYLAVKPTMAHVKKFRSNLEAAIRKGP